MDNRNVSILWHVKCYSLFTSKDKIRRLENRINKGETCTKPISSPRKTRAQIKQVDWDKCVFCQVHTNERVSAVMTFGMSEQIQEIAKLDYKMCTRLAGASDLIAAEAN